MENNVLNKCLNKCLNKDKNMPITRTIKKTTTKTKQAVQELNGIVQLKAAIKMCSETEIDTFLSTLTPEQINLIVDEVAPLDLLIQAKKKEIKTIEKQIDGLDKVLLQIQKLKSQKNIVTPEGFVSEVTEGRAKSEFTTTIHEFIELAKDAGHSDVIDEMVSIKKTEAEKYLGKSLVNKITQTTKEEYGGIKFSSIKN